MSTYFVTRHPGAVEWAARRGISADRTLIHLDLNQINPGDVVIGTLPVHLAAELCARGARYLHLAVDLPAERRGVELTADDLVCFNARLTEYRVERVAVCD
ncbi:MAG: CRISPR-associated protein Csx16 [Acidobacteria bacterium]|nr:CRISPR-associated protein Csx16 [Acidobacteriota bacterium]